MVGYVVESDGGSNSRQKTGAAMVGGHAPTTPIQPDQNPRKRSIETALGEVPAASEIPRYCAFCNKETTSADFICLDCAETLDREFSVKTIRKAAEEILQMDKRPDMFEEEPQIDSLEFCTTCCKYYMPSHLTDPEHYHLKVQKISERWFVVLPKSESWASSFKDAKEFQAKDNSAWIPLERPDALCCNCSDTLQSEGLYCNFMCRVKQLQDYNEYGWPSILVNEDFSAICRLNMICNSYPPKKFCKHCCTGHHLGLGVEAIDSTRSSYGVPNSLIEHVSGPPARCYAKCTRCSLKLSKTDCQSHGCFRNMEMVLRQQENVSPTQYNRDGFCINCWKSFSYNLCNHHEDHCTIRIIHYNERYSYCAVVPSGTWEVTSVFFGPVQELLHDEVDGVKIVPLTTCGSNNCTSCGATVDKGINACSFKCQLSSKFLVQQRSLSPKATSGSFLAPKKKKRCQRKYNF